MAPDRARIAALIAERRLEEAYAALVPALTAAPDDLDAAFLAANLARALGEAATAERLYRHVLRGRPESVEAANNLANMLTGELRPAEAIRLLRPTAVREPAFATLWLGLAQAERIAGDAERALTLVRRALAINPEDATALGALGDAEADAGRPRPAIAAFERAIARRPEDSRLHHNLAFALFTVGDFNRGFAEYEHRHAADLPLIRQGLPEARWEGEPLAGHGLLVAAEQGLGDEILFASCLPDLLGRPARLIVEADERLHGLLARSLPDVRLLARRYRQEGRRRIADYATAVREHGVDRWIPAGSLPRLLRRRFADFGVAPWLAADVAQRERWRGRLALMGGGATVGVAWRSRLASGRRAEHYADLIDLAPILRLPGVRFVNLQYDDCGAELVRAAAELGVEITAWDDLDLMSDLDGTAALMTELSAIVAPETTTLALAGALGVPTVGFARRREWAAPPDRPHGTPWYPTVRYVFRGHESDWAGAMRRATDHLVAILGGTPVP